MAIEPQDAYVQMLTSNLQRAIDWLKFAEAKNAGLLALTSGWIGFTLNLECSGKLLPLGFTISLWVTLLCALWAEGGRVRIRLTFSILATSVPCPSRR